MRRLFLGIFALGVGVPLAVAFFGTRAEAPKSATAPTAIQSRGPAMGGPAGAAEPLPRVVTEEDADRRAAFEDRKERSTIRRPADGDEKAEDTGIRKVLMADTAARGPLGEALGDKIGLDSKLGAALAQGVGDELVIGHGAGGMGVRGTGQGGGGEGVGRLHGLGRVDSGGGRHAAAERRQRGKPRPKPMMPAAKSPAPPPAPPEVVEEPVDMPVEVAKQEQAMPRSGERSRRPKKGKKKVADVLLLDELTIEDADEEEEESEEKNFEFNAIVVDGRDDLVDESAGEDGKERPARLDLGRLVSASEVERGQSAPEPPPTRFLPRMCYFENTYLGGNAAYQERLRRVEAELADAPHQLALLAPQPFDAPEDAGLRLTAALDRSYVDQPGRVMLQVGVQGSRRYGWRRPPLDVVLVVDPGDGEVVMKAADALMRRLGPQDRLAVLAVGEAEPVAPLSEERAVRTALIRRLDGLAGQRADADALRAALTRAGAMLSAGAGDTARVPGTQTVVLVTESAGAERVEAAQATVHGLTVQGVVTSVVQLGAERGAWWTVANAGHGNLHHAATPAALGAVLDAELDSLARVVGRLLRLNIRLGPDVEAIRVLGSRVLGQQEVVEVKAREVATDRNLSKTMGVKADRGEDDDGIQTVIPYFYGGDSHVILVELWVKRPGAVAEVSLKYKDMVALNNATARASVALTAVPRPETPAQRLVRKNAQGFGFALALDEAAAQAERGDWAQVRQTLRSGARTSADQAVTRAFERLLDRGGLENQREAMREALALAADRRIGISNGGPR